MAGYKICHDMKNGLIHCNLRFPGSLSYSNRPIYFVSTDNGFRPSLNSRCRRYRRAPVSSRLVHLYQFETITILNYSFFYLIHLLLSYREERKRILNFREKRERKKSGNELDLFNTPRKKLFFFSFNTKRVLVRGTTSGAIITLVNELALRNQPINTLPSNEKTSTGSLIIQSSLFPFSFTSIGRDHLR